MTAFFSIIIPVKEISYYLLFEGLPAFQKQTYKKFEVLVLPDEHVRYDLTLLRTHRWLRIIPTGKITKPGVKRTIGAQKAKGTILAFIDDDAYPKEDWLQQAYNAFKRNISIFCGPGMLAKNTGMWEKVFDEVLKSSLGTGWLNYRYTPGEKRFVDDYPFMNFFIKKEMYLKLSSVSVYHWPGEDSKICEELVHKRGYKILYVPEVQVYHHRRNNVVSHLRQFGRYGLQRGTFFAEGDRNSRKLLHALPSLFLIYLGFLLFLFPLNIFSIPFFIYVILTMYLSLKSLFITKNPIVSILFIPILFLTHLMYGAMFLKGYWREKMRYNNTRQ
ncbi:glycosyltransferase [Candidatus Roizmanbacteria bacterium]|nr:glycosyltransferase [Candidatus Roizmanbacteria bacterium]